MHRELCFYYLCRKYLAEFYAAGHIESILLWLNSMGGENEMGTAEIVKFLQTIRFKGVFPSENIAAKNSKRN